MPKAGAARPVLLSLRPWSVAAALGVVACHPRPTADAPRAVGPSAAAPAVALALDEEDLAGALARICAGYAEDGVPCAETVRLEGLAANDVMAHVNEDHVVFMPPMPPAGGGYAYWKNWSSILSRGTWETRALFADDETARRSARTLLVSVLAHELGHHVAGRFDCHDEGASRELRADELAVPLLRRLLPADRLVELRRLSEAMIGAVAPGDRALWTGTPARLPSAVPAYVTLHLSRQRRLFDEPERAVGTARRQCLEPRARYLASRVMEVGRVATTGRPLESRSALFALDRTGRIHAAEMLIEDGAAWIRHGNDPPVRVPMPGADVAFSAFAAASDDLLALFDGSKGWRIEGGVVHPLGPLPDLASLAFDASGRLWVGAMHEDAWRAGPLGAPPGFVLPRRQDRSAGWGDGPIAGVDAHPSRFAVEGSQLLFFDEARHAVRRLAAGRVTTLAGGLRGRRDGDAAGASFYAVEAVNVLGGGRIGVVDGALRVIEPR